MSFFCHTNNPNLKMFTIWNKTFTFGSWINYLMELLRQKRLQRERSGWDVDLTGEEKLSECSDRHFFLLCCLTLFCLVVHVSSSSFRLSFNRSSWMLSVEVQITVERLSELETAKKTPPDFIPPEASSVCLCRSIQRGSTDLRINQWCKCEGKGRSCSTIQSRIDDRLTSRLHTV